MRSRPRLRRTAAAVAAAALALALAGCGGPDEKGARAFVKAVTSPGAGWTAGGQGIDRFNSGAVRTGGIWKVADADGDGTDDAHPTYLTGWEVVVAPGQERARCTEAAAWMKKFGSRAPGNAVDVGAKAPSQKSLVQVCVPTLKPVPKDSASDTGFAAWPSVANGGYQYSVSSGSDINGTTVKLYVVAQVGPSVG